MSHNLYYLNDLHSVTEGVDNKQLLAEAYCLLTFLEIIQIKTQGRVADSHITYSKRKLKIRGYNMNIMKYCPSNHQKEGSEKTAILFIIKERLLACVSVISSKCTCFKKGRKRG